jgi:hypothetical protein
MLELLYTTIVSYYTQRSLDLQMQLFKSYLDLQSPLSYHGLAMAKSPEHLIWFYQKFTQRHKCLVSHRTASLCQEVPSTLFHLFKKVKPPEAVQLLLEGVYDQLQNRAEW